MAKGRKTGGRRPGSKNKTTSVSKQLITELLADYSESGLMVEDFKNLEPKDRMQVAEKLMQYVMPKMQSVGVEVSSNKEITIEARLSELAKSNE